TLLQLGPGAHYTHSEVTGSSDPANNSTTHVGAANVFNFRATSLKTGSADWDTPPMVYQVDAHAVVGLGGDNKKNVVGLLNGYASAHIGPATDSRGCAFAF